MSVHFDASRQQHAVRWRQEGRNRIRRFQTEAEAVGFERAVSGAELPGSPASSVEARLTEPRPNSPPSRTEVSPSAVASTPI